MWPVFVCSLVLGVITSIIFRVLLNLMAFWLLEARGVISFGICVALILTGAYMPVAFFPTWVTNINAWLPFSGMQNLPAQIFIGTASGPKLLPALALQAGWLVLLLVFTRWVTAVATRRVIVQGG
jgi:ABC-2 type transport system permease protein